MKLHEIKLSHIRQFLKWYHNEKENIPFTKKALWRIQKECWTAELEVFWDYRDELSSDQIEKIIDNGLEGYNEVYEDIWENNYDYCSDKKRHFIKEISIDADDLTEKFIKSAMEENECERKDVAELAEDALHEFISESFEEELSVDMNLDELVKKTTGAVFCDFEDMFLYDLYSIEMIKKNPEDWIYLVQRDLNDRGENEKLNEFHEEIISHNHIDELHSNAQFSVKVAEDLGDYIEMLVKLQDEKKPEYAVILKRGDGFNKTYLTSGQGGSLYFAREANYIDPDDNEYGVFDSFEVTDEVEGLIESDVYSGFDDFHEEVQKIVDAYLIKQIETKIGEDYEYVDSKGRTLLDYALLCSETDTSRLYDLFEYFYQNQYSSLYKTDTFGISPLALCVAIDNKDTEAIVTHMYGPILSTLPRRDATANDWSTKCTLKGMIDGKEHYVIESNDVKSFGADEYYPNSKVVAVREDDGTCFAHQIKDFDVLEPIAPITVYLDGTIAA